MMPHTALIVIAVTTAAGMAVAICAEIAVFRIGEAINLIAGIADQVEEHNKRERLKVQPRRTIPAVRELHQG
jgi:hypothetical protein